MDSIRQAKEELGQAPVPTTTLETNKQQGRRSWGGRGARAPPKIWDLS